MRLRSDFLFFLFLFNHFCHFCHFDPSAIYDLVLNLSSLLGCGCGT